MTTYAIILSGNKQYRVQPGQVIDIELIDGNKKESVEFKDVLLFSDGSKVQVGSPTLAEAVVRGEIVDEVRGPKVIAYKYKKRKRSTRHKIGHRQHYTRVKITEFAI